MIQSFINSFMSEAGRLLPAVVAMSLLPNSVYTEGSKDLFHSGSSGKRAYLMSRRSLADGHFAPFQTHGTTKVYAKVGEKFA